MLRYGTALNLSWDSSGYQAGDGAQRNHRSRSAPVVREQNGWNPAFVNYLPPAAWKVTRGAEDYTLHSCKLANSDTSEVGPNDSRRIINCQEKNNGLSLACNVQCQGVEILGITGRRMRRFSEPYEKYAQDLSGRTGQAPGNLLALPLAGILVGVGGEFSNAPHQRKRGDRMHNLDSCVGCEDRK